MISYCLISRTLHSTQQEVFILGLAKQQELITRMAEALKKLEEQLKCAICLDTYTDPKLLHCLHVYCRECLVRLVVGDQQGRLFLSCPSCRQATPIPASGSGVAGLQPAFQTNQLLEIWKDLKKAKDPVAQLEKVDGDVKNLIPPKKSTLKCSEHDEEELKLYCETCSQLICLHCTIRKHHSHEYDLVGEVFEKHKNEIESSLKPVEQHLTSVKRALTELDARCGEISDQRAAIEADIHSKVKRLYDILDAKKTELINTLHQITQRKLKDVAIQRDEMETTQAKLSSCLEFTMENLKTGSQEEILKVKTTITKRAQQLTSEFRPQMLNLKTEADIMFSDPLDISTKCKSYGQVVTSESPDPSNSYATGKGLEIAEFRKNTTADVYIINHKGEPCELKLLSLQCTLASELTGKTIEGRIMGKERGRCQISYKPVIKWKHQLHIKVEGNHIKGSPFPVLVRMPAKKLGYPMHTIEGLDGPFGVTINQRGQITVSEFMGNCVSVLSENGEKIKTFTTHGSGPGQFDKLAGVTVDRDGNILVVDNGNHCIQKFTSDGQLLHAVGVKGEGPLQFNRPIGIAFNTTNNKIYVADQFNDRVQVLNPDLTFYKSFGAYGSSKGRFLYPAGVSCDETGKVFIADWLNHRIQVFTAEGRFLKSFGKSGQDRGELNNPVSITTDSNGLVYVGEEGNYRISVFNIEGQFVTLFGKEGTGPGEFKKISGIFVNNDGIIYVCDGKNNRIQLF